MRKYRGPGVVVLLSMAILAAGPLDGVALAAPPDEADAVKVLTEDVYWYIGQANLINPDASTDPDEPLYNNSQIPVGTPGDTVTWQEWSAAKAASHAWKTGGPDGPRTDVRISMEGLVPNGVYSIFWQTVEPDSANPLCPGAEHLLPLDALQATSGGLDPSSFVADLSGEAEFHGRVEGDLLGATQVFFTVIYHLDGRTYYALPNAGEFLTQGGDCRSSFGYDALRHLLIGQKL